MPRFVQFIALFWILGLIIGKKRSLEARADAFSRLKKQQDPCFFRKTILKETNIKALTQLNKSLYNKYNTNFCLEQLRKTSGHNEPFMIRRVVQL